MALQAAESIFDILHNSATWGWLSIQFVH